MILDKINQLLKEVSQLSAKNADDIEQLRLKYLSKKGEINAVMADFRNVPADQKKAVGIKINELKKPLRTRSTPCASRSPLLTPATTTRI